MTWHLSLVFVFVGVFVCAAPPLRPCAFAPASPCGRRHPRRPRRSHKRLQPPVGSRSCPIRANHPRCQRARQAAAAPCLHWPPQRGGGVAGLSGRAIGELSGSAVAGLGESLLGGHRQLMMGVMSLGLGCPASGHVAERGAGLGEGPGGGARAGAGVRVYARSIYVSCICAASRIFVSCTCVMHPVSYCVYASIRGVDRRGRGDSRQDALSCLPARSRMGAHTHVRQF